MLSIKKIAAVSIVLMAVVLVYQFAFSNYQSSPQSSLEQLSPDTTDIVQSGVVTTQTSLVDVDESELGLVGEVVPESIAGPLSADYSPLPAYDIGNSSISDEAFIALVDRLNNDPELMADLIGELRSESDSKRLQRLMSILGSTQNAAVLPVAQEMIYSGIDSSRKAGLDLLSRIAPKNPKAYEVASDLLVSETDPATIIAALNIFAHPDAASPEVRDELATQVLTLVEHDLASVRGYSISVLTKLSKDPDLSPILYNALYDSSASVRNSAASAFSNFPYHSDEATQRLLELAENETELVRVRRGAYLALSNNSPDEALKARLKEIELSMRKKVRR